MKKSAFIVVYILVCTFCFAQNLPVRDFRIAREIEKFANSKTNSSHSSMKPYRNYQFFYNKDSISTLTDFANYQYKDNGVYLNILPLYELSGGLSGGTDKNFNLHERLGFIADFDYKTKISIAYKLTESYSYNRKPFITDSKSGNYNFDRLWGYYNNPRFAGGFFVEQTFGVTYRPAEFFCIEIGNGKHFYGDGHRSLLQSDICNNYPFLKLESQFLGFKYSCVWSIFDDIGYYYNLDNERLTADFKFKNGFAKKYNVTHYLDWRIGKYLNVSLFESIMSSKFLSLEYFNPVVFFRPVEFSLGSTENAMLGLNLKVSFMQKNCVYLQAVLDDVIVGQLKNDILHRIKPSYTGEYGWFANKWGLQAGIKFYDLFKVKHLDCFLEGNVVRPYVYSHSNQQLTHTHGNKPLAHPLGANFVEGLGGISYYNDKFACDLKVSYAVIGCDSTQDTHYGQNIFYTTMDAYWASAINVVVLTYGNVLLQGIRTKVATIDFEFSYFPLKNKSLSVFCDFVYRRNSNILRSDNFYGVFLGLRSQLLR